MAKVNPNFSTTDLCIRDFTRMNPPIFYGSKVEEDPQGFIDEVFKVFGGMVVSSQEKEELEDYKLKYVAQVWNEKWKDERPLIEGRITWEALKKDCLVRFFPFELRDNKSQEFINFN